MYPHQSQEPMSEEQAYMMYQQQQKRRGLEQMEIEKETIKAIEPAFKDKLAKTIVFAPDNNYCKYFGATLKSLIANSKPHDYYDIIIFENDITERNKKILRNMLPDNFSLRFFQVYPTDANILNLLSTREYWSVSMYYRIFIPLLLYKFDKVLYCDSDLVFNAPLNELFETDFEGNEILAVTDIITPITEIHQDRKAHLEKELGLKYPER